jgi:hypothetical protein
MRPWLNVSVDHSDVHLVDFTGRSKSIDRSLGIYGQIDTFIKQIPRTPSTYEDFSILRSSSSSVGLIRVLYFETNPEGTAAVPHWYLQHGDEYKIYKGIKGMHSAKDEEDENWSIACGIGDKLNALWACRLSKYAEAKLSKAWKFSK